MSWLFKQTPSGVARSFSQLVGITVMGLPVLMLVVVARPELRSLWYIFFGWGLLIVFTLAGISNYIDERAALAAAEADQKAAASEAKEKPTELMPALDSAVAKLNVYISRNLSQTTLIFYLSVAVIVIGIGMIAAQLFLRWFPGGSQDVGTLSIAAGSGVLTQFVGAILMLMYRSSIAQASTYAALMARMNDVGIALRITDQLSSSELRDQTRATVASSLLGGAVQTGYAARSAALPKQERSESGTA